jgi:hypothetical protein
MAQAQKASRFRQGVMACCNSFAIDYSYFVILNDGLMIIW